MRRLPRHSRRWSPAVLRLVCMRSKVVPNRGPIHYVLGNDRKEGPVLHTPEAYSNIPLVTFPGNRFAGGDAPFFGHRQPKKGRRDQSCTDVQSIDDLPKRPKTHSSSKSQSASFRRGSFIVVPPSHARHSVTWSAFNTSCCRHFCPDGLIVLPVRRMSVKALAQSLPKHGWRTTNRATPTEQ